MAPNGTVFGGRKLRGGRDEAEEQAALQWIFGVIREPVPANAHFDEVLKDGQVLCRFMQKIEPSLIKKINTSGGPIKLMENLGMFNEACRKLGVNHVDLFLTTDLWDKRDIGAVYNCLSQLGGILQRIRPDLPAYGPKIAEDNKRGYNNHQRNETNSVQQHAYYQQYSNPQDQIQTQHQPFAHQPLARQPSSGQQNNHQQHQQYQMNQHQQNQNQQNQRQQYQQQQLHQQQYASQQQQYIQQQHFSSSQRSTSTAHSSSGHY